MGSADPERHLAEVREGLADFARKTSTDFMAEALIIDIDGTWSTPTTST